MKLYVRGIRPATGKGNFNLYEIGQINIFTILILYAFFIGLKYEFHILIFFFLTRLSGSETSSYRCLDYRFF